MSHRTSTACATEGCTGRVVFHTDARFPNTTCVRCRRASGKLAPRRTSEQVRYDRDKYSADLRGLTVEQFRADQAARKAARDAMTPAEREAHRAARKAEREAALEAELALI